MRALLLGEDGTTLGMASAAYGIRYPRPAWAEQDPADWMRGLSAAVRELVATTGVKAREISALGLAAQVDGVVAVDDELRALTPAIIWMDRRATRQTDLLRKAIGVEEVRQTTGLNLDPYHVAPKISWLRDETPGLAAATRAYLPPGPFVVAQLTGELAIDHANASSTLLYDIVGRRWSDRMLSVTGIDAAVLPPIAPAEAVVGPLRAGAAAELGLEPDCVVVVGTGDEHGACLAAGAITPDVLCDITGTAEPVAVASSSPIIDPTGLVETHAHADSRAWLVENPGFVSGGSVRWFLDLAGWSQADMGKVASVPAGSDGVTFLPALSGSMTPRWNEHARGAFAGLGLNHGLPHLGRAVLEGCTFALRDLVARFAELGLGGDEVRVVGGGARSDLWLQMKADVTGRPVRVLRSAEATALGAAELAAVGAGMFRDLDEAVGRLTELEPGVYEPDRSLRGAYDDAYGRYRSLFDAVEPLSDGGAHGR